LLSEIIPPRNKENAFPTIPEMTRVKPQQQSHPPTSHITFPQPECSQARQISQPPHLVEDNVLAGKNIIDDQMMTGWTPSLEI
jgi:hypothetical protein